MFKSAQEEMVKSIRPSAQPASQTFHIKPPLQGRISDYKRASQGKNKIIQKGKGISPQRKLKDVITNNSNFSTRKGSHFSMGTQTQHTATSKGLKSGDNTISKMKQMSPVNDRSLKYKKSVEVRDELGAAVTQFKVDKAAPARNGPAKNVH